MAKLKITASILCFVCLIALAAALSVSLYGVAYADEPYAFTVKTEDGETWQLLGEGEEIGTYTGKFFNPPSVDVVSVQVESAMKAKLEEVGKERQDYALTFVLPDFEIAAFEGLTTMGYTEDMGYTEESDRPLFVETVDFSTIVGNEGSCSLQYKLNDAPQETNYTTSPASRDSDGKMMFGASVDVGTYTVRAVIRETFTFGLAPEADGAGSQDADTSYLRNYAVERYSGNTLEFTIEKSLAKPPKIDVVAIKYGTTAGEIGSLPTFPDRTGAWTLADDQEDPAFENAAAIGDVYLKVADENHTVRMVYAPYNQNYYPTETDIEVLVEPKSVDVLIDDASSLCHEPLVAEENLTYDVAYLKGQLVAGDSIESIGISLYIENGDSEKPGYYLIKATIADPNYIAVSRNKDPQHAYWHIGQDGGRYTVFGISQTVYAEDGMCFEVLFVTDTWKVRVESDNFRDKHPSDPIIEGKSIPVKAYRFVFTDAAGKPVYPESYAVKWVSAPEGALFAAHYVNDKLSFVYADANEVTLSEQGVYADTLYFYGLSLLTGYNIMLIVVTCVFGAGAAICAAILIIRRRMYK